LENDGGRESETEERVERERGKWRQCIMRLHLMNDTLKETTLALVSLHHLQHSHVALSPASSLSLATTSHLSRKDGWIVADHYFVAVGSS